MRDWAAYVCERLRLPDLPPERESRIVRELAAQLEDFYREALAAGAYLNLIMLVVITAVTFVIATRVFDLS